MLLCELLLHAAAAPAAAVPPVPAFPASASCDKVVIDNLLLARRISALIPGLF